ncbi:exosortase A [Sphingomonas bacterium]|uniref:exosortase A n=1 Tax=Sphingomonas bacterium TaxID=1895847 RepID=UPI00262E7BE5|nr:exosortase A [Sphingomonas bacterium]MDB5678013.1 exosortase [Sphingomonas bacterium]
MNSVAQTAPHAFSVGPAWRRPLVALGLVAVVLLAMFRHDVGDLADLYWTNTTFGHCLFIAPVIGWLVWIRRAELAKLTPQSWAPGLALVAAGGLGWLLGDAAGVSFARHLGLVMMLQGAVVTTLGPNVARGLLFPLAYALFLVPFGDFLEPPLQTITVWITMHLLHLVGVAATVDGVLITAGDKYFEVAEACSGSKFVIAMVAYGVLVANLCYRTWPRRMAFMAMAIVVPVLANGLRAFGTIYAAVLTSVEQATGYDHIVFGWVFFGLVMAAVLAIGWKWFDRAPDAPAFDPAKLQGAIRWRLDLVVASALVLATAAVFPVWSAAIANRAQALPAHIDLPQVAGWTRAPVSARAPWTPTYPGADHQLFGRYVDADGNAVDLAIAVYGSQRQGKEIVGFGIGIMQQDDRWVRIKDLDDLDGGQVIDMSAAGPVERQVATWYRVGDVTTSSGKIVKLQTLKAKLFGGPQRAVAIHVSAEVLPGHEARAAMAKFLAALGSLDVLADRSAGMAN